MSPILDARTGRAACELISVTVGAADCMTADALTKVVFALRGEAAPLLARYSADALLLEQDGGPPGCFTQRATRPARLNPIEALSQTLALRRICAAFFSGAAWAY